MKGKTWTKHWMWKITSGRWRPFFWMRVSSLWRKSDFTHSRNPPTSVATPSYISSLNLTNLTLEVEECTFVTQEKVARSQIWGFKRPWDDSTTWEYSSTEHPLNHLQGLLSGVICGITLLEINVYSSLNGVFVVGSACTFAACRSSVQTSLLLLHRFQTSQGRVNHCLSLIFTIFLAFWLSLNYTA